MSSYEIRNDRFLLRLFYFIVSLFGAACGVALIFKSQLGADPANVFLQGLYRQFGLSIGFWITLLWLTFIGIAFVIGLKPYIATLLDLIFFGPLVDGIMHVLSVLSQPVTFPMQAAYLLSGIVVLSVSVGVYLNARLGAGPTMLFTYALASKTKLSIGKIKTFTDLLFLVMGYLLGGTVGIGTVTLALGIGYAFQFFITHIRLPGLD